MIVRPACRVLLVLLVVGPLVVGPQVVGPQVRPVTHAVVRLAAAEGGERGTAPMSVAPLPVVPRGAYGWPLGPDRGVTGGAAGPPARSGEDGSVARRFRAPPQPFGRGHRGVDLAGSAGEPVRAAGAGVVTFAGRLAGRGVVAVDHAGGLRTTYEPVAATIAVGAPVGRGAPIGTLEAGHAGCPASACLHWGLRRPAARPGPPDYLDPLLLVGLGHVRLWPATP